MRINCLTKGSELGHPQRELRALYSRWGIGRERSERLARVFFEAASAGASGKAQIKIFKLSCEKP